MTTQAREATRDGATDHAPATLAAIGEVLGQVAHEINNPLAGIQNAFLLLKDAVPPTHPHFNYVAAIEREIGRISRLSRRLADADRLQGTEPPGASPAWIITDAMRRVEQAQASKGIHVRVELRNPPAQIDVSAELLWQALYQVAQNAGDAAFAGATLMVTAWMDGTTFCCAVQHPGPGRGKGHKLGAILAERAVATLGGTLEFVEPEAGGAEWRLRLDLPPTGEATT